MSAEALSLPFPEPAGPSVVVHHGDCLDVLRGMADASVDAVVTDPPYELGFMGRKWDASGIAYSVDLWREVLRVLKPGGHLLAFGGTRTYHRQACAIEDAGFEIRDTIAWMYGQGFPKSHNLDGAHKGWGTALKPAHEPVTVARKPLVGTVAANVLAHGTGALNVDGCRVDGAGGGRNGLGDTPRSDGWSPDGVQRAVSGRWPPNVLLTHSADCVRVGDKSVRASNAPGMDRGSALGRMNDDGWQAQERKPQSYGTNGTETVPAYECAADCPVALLDAQTDGVVHSAGAARAEPGGGAYDGSSGIGFAKAGSGIGVGLKGFRIGDSGGASRFFPTFEHNPFLYQAKASKRDRGEGNKHPTVKPTALMRWLVRLVTPPGGTVLDPFAGSGTTLVAAKAEGFNAIGIEREAEYVEIIKARVGS